MFLSTTLCLFSTKLLKDINTPAKRVIVPLVAVELVESFEFCVRDREVCVYLLAPPALNGLLGKEEGKEVHWKLLSIRDGVTLFGSTELPR